MGTAVGSYIAGVGEIGGTHERIMLLILYSVVSIYHTS